MNYVKEELTKQKVKDLLVIAKDLFIVGRHDMNKEDLVKAIIHYQELLNTGIAGKSYPVPNKTDDEFRASALKKFKDKKTNEILHIDLPDTCIKDCETEQCTKCTNDTSMNQESSELNVAKPKIDYITHIKKGQILAFKINGEKVLSGKVDTISDTSLGVITKNGIKFEVFKNNVIWVRTGARWPKGVYLALRGEAKPDEYLRSKELV